MFPARSERLHFGFSVVQYRFDFPFNAFFIEMSHVSHEREIQLPVQALHFLTPLNGNRKDIGQTVSPY